MTWHEAMKNMELISQIFVFGLELVNLNEVVKDVEFMVFLRAR